MIVIAGLGNPGQKYAHTRHNMGFDVVDELANRHGISIDKSQHKALTGKGIIGGVPVLLVKPQTFMNLSGESVGAIASYYRIDPEDVYIIFDDISLDVGQIRIRKKGSAGGHNGLKNIILHLGHDGFKRVRMGVGEKPQGYDLADYVLGHFPSEERKIMEESVARAVDAIGEIMTGGVDKAMNLYN